MDDKFSKLFEAGKHEALRPDELSSLNASVTGFIKANPLPSTPASPASGSASSGGAAGAGSFASLPHSFLIGVASILAVVGGGIYVTHKAAPPLDQSQTTIINTIDTQNPDNENSDIKENTPDPRNVIVLPPPDPKYIDDKFIEATTTATTSAQSSQQNSSHNNQSNVTEQEKANATKTNPNGQPVNATTTAH